MKRIFSLFALASLAVLSLSCEKEIESPESGKAELYTYSFEAFDADADKSTFDGSSKITWKEGDEVGYFVSDFSGNSVIGSDQIFKISTTEPVSGETLYAYVPYVAGNASKTSVNITIPESQDSDNLVMPAFGSATVAADGVVPIKLSNLGSIVAFKLYSATGAYSSEKVTSITMTSTTNAICGTFTKDITASSALEISGYDKNAVTVSVNGDLTAASSKENATVVYAVIAPGTYDGNIVVTTDAATYTYPFSSQTFKRSHSKGLVLNFEKAGVRESVEPTPDPVYVKVTSDSDLTDGQYLIVCEDQNLAFNGALETLDAVSNTVAVTISNGEIASSTDIDAAAFTFTAADGSFLGTGGKYFGNSANSNALNSSTTALTNTVSIIDGDADIVSAGGSYLRYNATSGQTRFRYYKSSTYTAQKAIQLYKKNGTPVPPATKYTITVPDNITGGSLTPSKTEAEAGETVTITANPAAGYQLSTLTANVTGESLKGNILTFIMPEANVTISASFEEIPSVDYSGEYIIIGTDGENGYFAMNQYVEGNNCKGKSVSYTNGSVSGNNLSTCKVTLSPVEGKDGYYTILDSGGKFLYAASTSSNYLKGNDTDTAAAAHWYVQCIDNEWTVIADNTGKDNLHNVMRYNYNSGSPIFACYASATQNAVILVKWDKVEDIAVEPVDATWSVTPESVSVYEGETAKVTITTNYDGTLQVESGSIDTATATISGKTITVNGVSVGTTTLTIRGSATVNYKEIVEYISVTVSEKPTTSAITITSDDVVSDSGYTTYSNNDWIITFGGNNLSVGTNKSNRSECNLNDYSKYAVSPITTSNTASAFASLKSLSDVSKITYTFNGGSNQTNTNVYLLYSSDNNTFSPITLKKGTQGATISSDTVFEFDKCSGYFAVVFVATNSSGNWRIDNVELTFE